MSNEKRIIPALQLYEGRLVKTLKFQSPIYVGDPLNIISIFNELEVDEILINQISLASKRDSVDFGLLEKIASQSLAPLAYGGGVISLDDAKRIIDLGFEKIVFSTGFHENPKLVSDTISTFGSQAIVICLDIKQKNDQYLVTYYGNKRDSSRGLKDTLSILRELNPGEVLLNNVSRDGTRTGYDLDLVNYVKHQVNQPVIALGGAGSRLDLSKVLSVADAAAASSLFIFKSNRKNQLINYPTISEKKTIVPNLRDYLSLRGQTNFGSPILIKRKISNDDREIYCKNCIIAKNVPGSNLENAEICAFCILHDKLDNDYPNGTEGEIRIEKFIAGLKKDGLQTKYDCILGVSGGADSSYLMHFLSKRGLRILAIHFDNTWNSPIATSNIYKMTSKLNIDLETYVVDNHEYDDLYKSFLKSGVKDLEAPTDIGFISVLYKAAAKHKIKHIVEGHSFRTEGVSPLGWLYMDGGYIKSVHKKYGTIKLKTYPNLSFFDFVRWTTFSNVKRTRPLYWLKYSKNEARELLSREYDWEWYGGHHLENRFTAFYHSYFLPMRFDIDFRQIEFSALVRSGFMARTEALAKFNQERVIDSSQLHYVINRLGFNEAEFELLMRLPMKDFKDFRTYKKYFELSKPFFYLLMKFDKVPLSFYEKFCK